MQAPFADPLTGLEPQHGALPLVGREAEIALLRSILVAVASDLPVGARALTISGEVGSGKTRLLAEMCAAAREGGFRVLEGRAYEPGNRFPYFPFIEALRPLLRGTPRARLRSYLGLGERAQGEANGQSNESGNIETAAPIIPLSGTPLVAALASLFPELPGSLRVTIPAEILAPDQEKFRLMDAVATLLENVAQEQPVLLYIDNLQWADGASLELMLYLTVRLHRSRVALVGATRPPQGRGQQVDGEAGTDENTNGVTLKAVQGASRALGELARQGLLLILPLGPLSTEAATQHLHHLLPGTLADGLVEPLLARAGGNPFFLEELVRMLTLKRQLVQDRGTWYARGNSMDEQALPESITLAVGQRLQSLSEACRNLLRIASLFGRTFPLNALIVVSGESEEAVMPLIDEAGQAALIAPSPVSTYGRDEGKDEFAEKSVLPAEAGLTLYMFRQGIVQEVLSAGVPPLRRRTLHAAIGKALEATYSDGAVDSVSGKAAHAAELARHYVLGGEQGAALRWSLLAGEEAARQQAHREVIGHFQRVLSLLEAGIHLPDEEFVPSFAQLHTAIGESWFKLGELEEAAEAFQQALQGAAPSASFHPSAASPLSSLQLAHTNRLLADVYRMQGKYDQALAHLQATQSALEFDSERDDKPRETMSNLSWSRGRTFADSNVLVRTSATAVERILFLQARATLFILLNQTTEAEAALWQSHHLAVEIGDRGSQAFALYLVGWLRGWGEHIHEALRLQKQSYGLYLSIGDPYRATLCEQGFGIIYQALGEMEEARRYTEQGIKRARRYGVRFTLGWLYLNLGTIALAQGDWAAAENHLQAAQQEAVALNNTRLLPVILQTWAELHFRRGDWREAEQHFQASITAAANTEWYPGSLALYGHFLAVTGRRAAARAQLERAVSHVEPSGFAGSFYIPFLAEGFLHLEDHSRAATCIERVRSLHGFMYYGVSVDRILGIVAAHNGQWEMAEQAFEEGLALCQRARNAPEEAMILYERARCTLLHSGSRSERAPVQQERQRIQQLCQRAREIFQSYEMQRAITLVDTLQEGMRQLEQQEQEQESKDKGQTQDRIHQKQAFRFAIEELTPSGYHLDLSLTKRELEVLRLVAEGHTDREVADALVISPRTVNRHLSNIFVKLDVPGRAAAVAYAIRQGLV
ncbi:MAG TPA: AAA family ATPase [Ktedonobacteraceae bacterium]|nr:AAA family ATPase [Ktedonobacteraceae bacterium]